MAARKVIIRQTGVEKGVFATGVLKSPKGYEYFVFTTDDRAKALQMTERKALTILDSWRDAERAPAGRCVIEPT